MKLSLYTDGGSRGNPGPAAGGIVIYDSFGKKVKTKSKYLGETTNNQAEYQALILGLTEVIRQAKLPTVVELAVYMDSELVIRQMKGEYRVKEPTLKPLYEKAHELATEFGGISFTHVRREKNTVADQLVNDELDRQ